jgi:hypothetical protein
MPQHDRNYKIFKDLGKGFPSARQYGQRRWKNLSAPERSA